MLEPFSWVTSSFSTLPPFFSMSLVSKVSVTASSTSLSTKKCISNNINLWSYLIVRKHTLVAFEMLIILSIFSQLSRSMKSHDNRNFDINRLKCLPSFRCLCFVSMSWTMTAWAIGIIIAVVAVLLTHMDRKHVINMKPSINLQWLRGISWTDLFIQKHV